MGSPLRRTSERVMTRPGTQSALAEAKATALNIVASEVSSGAQTVPVTFEIVEAFAHYLDGALEEVNFDAVQTGRPISGEARIRITDNPKNIDFAGLQLEITDSLSGDRLTFTGDVQANQEVVFRITDPIIFNPGDFQKIAQCWCWVLIFRRLESIISGYFTLGITQTNEVFIKIYI